MKVARIVLTGLLATLPGCAGSRPYSSSSPPSGGSTFPQTTPDTTPHLGNPAPQSGSSSGSSFFRGTSPAQSGPSLRRPEAKLDDPALRSQRLAAGWQATAPETQTTRYRPETTATPVSVPDRRSSNDEPEWNRALRSADRRPIETLRMGSGPQRIMILGSLHGDETQSVAIVGELARHLRAYPESLRSATVLIVRTPNPDGFEMGNPYNVHGVDLNRNFPSTNWKTLPNNRAGSQSGGEAETRAVVGLLADFRPTLILHLKDNRQGTVVNSEGNVGSLAERIARLAKGKAVQGLGSQTSGSIEDYAMTRLSCPSLTLLLGPETDSQAAWTKNREALLAALGTEIPADRRTGGLGETPHPFDRPGIYNSSLRNERAPATPSDAFPELTDARRRGPRTMAVDFPQAIPDHGYVELPAP